MFFQKLLLHFLACFSLYSLSFNPCVETDPAIQVTSMERKPTTNLLYTHMFMQVTFSNDPGGLWFDATHFQSTPTPKIVIFNINIQKNMVEAAAKHVLIIFYKIS